MDERPGPPAVELSDGEQRLLDLIREGAVDAEIAVRLGLSNGEIKHRIERLSTRLGVDGRQGLRTQRRAPEAVPGVGGRPAVSRLRAASLLPILVIAGLVLAFVAGLVVASRGDDGAPDTVVAEVTPTVAATNPPLTPAATATPRIDVIDGREMEYGGQLFVVASHGSAPVASVSAREKLLAVTLADGGFIRFGFTWSSYTGGPFGVTITGSLRDRNVALLVSPGDEHTNFITGDSDSVGVYTRDPSRQPVVIMSASGAPGEYHLDMNQAGEIFVSREPVLADAVYDDWTGELLDVSPSARIWKLDVGPGGFFFNRCYEGPCELVVASPAMSAPADGVGRCDPPDELRYEMHDVTWLFRRAGSSRNGPPLTCDTRSYAEGEIFIPLGHYIVTAELADGTPLSIAASGDGHVYVGTFRGTVGCPCQTGS